MFVCVCGFSSNFSLIWNRHNAGGDGLQSLNYARHSLSLSSGSFLACHIKCDTKNSLIMVRGPVTLTPFAERLAAELSSLFYDLYLSRLGFEHPNFRMLDERSNRLHHRRSSVKCKQLLVEGWKRQTLDKISDQSMICKVQYLIGCIYWF